MALLLLKAEGEVISVKYCRQIFQFWGAKTCHTDIFFNCVNGKWGSFLRNHDPVTGVNPL